jgi:hypothetical protein
MNDLTVLYYTASRISEKFALSVRLELMTVLFRLDLSRVPVVAVSQKPPTVRFSGPHICMGEIGASIYNCYRQILIAAKNATTTYVACCEDDTLYSPEHFAYRPALDTFAYDRNRWVITRRLAADGQSREAFFYFRERTQMAMCIAPRQLLIDTLEERFAKYPVEVTHEVAKRTGWGEPGRYEKNLGLAPRQLEYFRGAQPCVTFNHGESLMGRRQVQPTDVTCANLPPWGDATALWERVHG